MSFAANNRYKQGKYDQAPIHIAAFDNQLEVLRQLIKLGADPLRMLILRFITLLGKTIQK